MAMLHQLADAQASGALAELAAQTPANRPAWWLIAAVVAAVLALCVGAGDTPRRRNPKPPRHLGEALDRWTKRSPPLAKRAKALASVLTRLDRKIDLGGKGVGTAYAQRRLVKEAWKRSHNAFQREATLYNNALHEAEAKYDNERSWRPIKKNPPPRKHLGRILADSMARIERLQARKQQTTNSIRRLQRIDRDELHGQPLSGKVRAGRASGDLAPVVYLADRIYELAQSLNRIDDAIWNERKRQGEAVRAAEMRYDAERAHRPIKKNPRRPHPLRKQFANDTCEIRIDRDGHTSTFDGVLCRDLRGSPSHRLCADKACICKGKNNVRFCHPFFERTRNPTVWSNQPRAAA